MQLLTIVFTDVVESSATKRDVSLGRDNRERDHAYLENIQTHYFHLIRASYRTHGGKEVNTMGDAFYLTFEDPVEAVRCAVDIQKHLASEPIETPRGPLRLRIGIHSGYPEFFDGGWHGTDVDTAARVESAARERQILLSARTHELVRHMSDLKFHAHGEFALKGVERISLYEADWDGKGRRPTGVSPLAVQQRKMWVTTAVAITIGIVALSAVVSYRAYIQRQAREAAGLPASINSRRAVAVLGFKNLGKSDANALSVTLSEMFSTELAAGGQLRTVSGEDVVRAKVDLSLSDAPSYAADTLLQIRKRLAVDAVVLGSYMEQGEADGGKIWLELRGQNTSTGETLCIVSKVGTKRNLIELVSKVGAELRQHLGVAAVTSTQETKVRAAFPSDPEVTRSYAEGLARLRLFDAIGARDLLEKTVNAAPDFALGHAALAEAWSSLGYDERGQEEAKKALNLSPALAREDQMVIEGRYDELNSAWDKAASTYGSLAGYFPDNSEYRLRLANAQTSAGKGQDALATVEELRKFPSPQKDDPRIDLAEGVAAMSLSDFKREAAADEQAIGNARAQGARFLLAQGLMDQCWATYKLGDLLKARSACEEAKTTFALAGDRKDSARTLTRLADILRDQGDADAALKLHEEALQNMREIGSQQDIAGALVNVATLLFDRGDMDAAEKNYREALSITKEIDDKKSALEYANDLASVFYAKGAFGEAKGMYEQALANARNIGDNGGVGLGLMNTGLMLSLEGDIPEAQKKIQEALAIERRLGAKSDVAFSLGLLGDVFLTQDNLDEAEHEYRESFAIRKQLGEKGALASSEISLAMVALEKGLPSQAEVLARQGEKEFGAEKDVNNEASSREVLARALLDQGKLPEAESMIEGARKLRVQDRTVLLSLRITDARLKARTGKKSEALRGLSGVIHDAESMKLPGYEFEARLAKAEIELQGADSPVSRSDLKILQERARQKSFLLIGRKAAQLARRTAA
jgi:eukaryotic-like serine/threonine-protein kinase